MIINNRRNFSRFETREKMPFLIIFMSMCWDIVPASIDAEIQTWRDRANGRLKKPWDWICVDADPVKIIETLQWAKAHNRLVRIHCKFGIWSAQIL
jgi:hypothetical protein